MIFYYQSIDDATLSSSITPTTGYPLTNLQDRNESTEMRGTFLTAGSTITMDFGSGGRAADHLILGGYTASGGATSPMITLEHSTDNVTYTEAFADEDLTSGRFLKAFGAVTAKRYWRIKIYDGDAVDAVNMVIGTIFIGSKITLSRNPDLNAAENYEFSSVVSESLGGGRFGFGNHDNERMSWNYSFDYINTTDRTNLIAFYRDIYAGEVSRYPFYFNDPAGSLHFARLIGVGSITEIGYQAYTTSIALEEEL